jgi:hypothetical protein
MKGADIKTGEILEKVFQQIAAAVHQRFLHVTLLG